MLSPFSTKNSSTYHIKIKGLVQGVGFRPFIYRVASKNQVQGWVENRNDGVAIKITCTEEILNHFLSDVKQTAPPASEIESVEVIEVQRENFSDFSIIKSKSFSEKVTNVSPDIAVCNDCLRDMKEQQNRIDYPFINCTNCGPRFTIIQDLPYDREKTTMKDFLMCPLCKAEYTDINDRRFHAQPVACSNCGPQYSLHLGDQTITSTNEIIKSLAELIHNKKIVAVKGLGGFFLSCDAQSEETVSRLRKLKNREGKPFAVMFSDISTLKEYASVNEKEEYLLLSARRPIVLLEQNKQLAQSVNVGFKTIGTMLPYMPLHYLLFEKLNLPAIVLTSGNLSDEPIITDNDFALKQFSGIADAVLTYNRDIHNRTDDSVVTIVNEKERIFRRSRGYVPSPINLNANVEGILATGAELVNCFCIGKDSQAIISQHIGDLKNIETYDFFCETIERFKKLFRFSPNLVVSDLHPDYLSSQYAAQSSIKHLKVQHHHAHIASCMAEHKLDEKVIGISFDGTGLGDDNNIWGSEFMVCDLADYSRITHFEFMPMPGGDKVTDEPWRMAVSYLYRTFGRRFTEFNLPFLKDIPSQSVEILCDAIDRKINSPLTSGSGRLFDAVAALINLCTNSKFHAEAPMRLESVIKKGCTESYKYSVDKTISFAPAIKGIVEDIQQNISNEIISAKFHNTIVKIIADVACKIRDSHQLNRVVLSGGTFQNKYLLENTEKILAQHDFQVYSHLKVPTNDAGIALGQMVIAAKKIELGLL